MYNVKSILNAGIAQVLAGSVLISLVGIFLKILVVDYALPVLVVVFWRNLFVCIALLAGLKIFKPKLILVSRNNLFILVFYGFLLALMNGIWGGSVYFNGAGVATVLIYLSVPLTVLGQWLLGGGKPSVRLIPSIVLCLVGCAVVCGIQGVSDFALAPVGMFLGLLSGVFYAGYALLGRECALRGLNAFTVLMYIFGFSSFFMLIINIFSNGMVPGAAASPAQMLLPGMPFKVWGLILTLAMGPTMMGWLLINMSLSKLTPSIANILLTTDPMVTALVAIPVLNEIMTAMQWVGCFLITGGVMLLGRRN
ncbi:DMT family transporter [Desulfovibrio gilichinskyi]|uniref:Threonine/homoserine efflux transporter RhtA n=1 Tax=Desulfovibrio gilichinskyi TaxID=1519643 RepID=A0A1X7F362_9BACT|nr:DMT family transporter [Desulfovibrio gilichinskyi]SMF44824.1 Threonine/homoserine efflux transporter RhtA [Desulfovibrio gilichinskyi]